MVTLVIPVYNMERYLPRCFASIQAQTCSDFEVVLVDDGSTDASGALCDAYAAEMPDRVRVIHKPNGGLSSARNAGIDAARGEFIIFPDPDDWVEPHYVESMLTYQREYEADLVCLGHYVDTGTNSVPTIHDGKERMLLGREGQRGLLLPPRMEGFCWNKLYRLDLIRSRELRFPDGMGTTEDLWFGYCYLAHCSRVYHAPTQLVYHYCQREDSSTQSGFSREKIDTIKTYEHIIRDCAERDPELARLAQDRICTIAVNLIWLLENAPEKDASARKYLLSYIRRLLPGYLRSAQFGFGRKFQAILAAISPRVFMHLKNAVQCRRKEGRR